MGTHPLADVNLAGTAHTLELVRRTDNRSRRPAAPPTNGSLRVQADRVVLSDIARVMGNVDPQTAAHAERTATRAQQIARGLALPDSEVATIRLAGQLHDIGKARIPTAILNKPGELSDSEWAVVKQHPESGYQMLRDVPGLESVAIIVRHHHERYDGSGYPAGLAGEDIPLGARIMAVSDAFEAMRSERPYKRALSLDEAVEELRQNAGGQFDPAVVDAFLNQVLERAPAA